MVISLEPVHRQTTGFTVLPAEKCSQTFEEEQMMKYITLR